MKVESTPTIKSMLTDEEYIVQVGQKIKDYKNLMEYYSNKIKAIEKKSADIKNELAMRMLEKTNPVSE